MAENIKMSKLTIPGDDGVEYKFDIVDEQARTDISKLSEEKVDYTEVDTLVETAVENEKGNIVQLLIAELQGLPVFGVVDENNTITVTSQLSDGTYSLMYENADGTLTEVGTITVGNGESESVETNQIRLSLASDDTEYVGANGEDGYSIGYRINSSGVEIEEDGMCCTGYIPYTDGQVIRLKNVTVAGTKTPYLVEYHADKIYKQVLSLSSALTDDGSGVLTGTASTGTRFIRITCGVIDDTSVLTLDTEIV